LRARLVRDVKRKLSPSTKYQTNLELFKKVLIQKRHNTQKIYFLHEPHGQCISKGKEHKKYEFGSKVSIITTKDTSVIIDAINIAKSD